MINIFGIIRNHYLNKLDECLLERMLSLDKNPLSGRNLYQDPVRGETYSNCLGTALHVHGLTGFDFPTFLEGFSFNGLFEKIKKPGSIFFMSDPDEPLDCHAGIFIQRHKGLDTVFEQRGCWGAYSCYKPEELRGDEATFGFGKYQFSHPIYKGKLDFYYPIKGKEEEIKARVKKTMLASEGIYLEDLRRIERLEAPEVLNPENSSSLREYLRRNEQLLTKQSYFLHKISMEKDGKEPFPFLDFAKRSFLADLAMKKGSTTSFAMRHFVTEETDRDFLNSLAA